MSNSFPHQEKAPAYLTRQLNLKLGLAFTPNDLLFGPVDTIAGSTEVLVTVQARDADRFRGTTQIRVRRQDIGALLAGIHVRISAPMTASTYEILPVINAKYRLALTEDDIHKESFSLGYLGPITVRTRPGSLMWIGQFTVDLMPPPSELDTVIIQGTYTDLVYPASLDTTRAIAEIRFGAIHATDVQVRLTALEVGDVLGANGEEGEFMPGVDKRPYWYVDLQQPGDHNLAGAVVIYNGANDGVYSTGDHTYAYVCVLELSERCTAFAGRLVLVYN